MRRRIRLRKLVTTNWQAKLICLAAAVVVWLMVNHLLVRGGSVGKTHVICALLRDLVKRGFTPMGCKPVSCGDRQELRSMREAAGAPATPLDSINPLYLRTAADPRMGAEFERRSVSISELSAHCAD